MKHKGAAGSIRAIAMLSAGAFLAMMSGGEPRPASETPGAAKIREEIAALERLLPTYADRGAVLFQLAGDEVRLGEYKEALRLLKECVSLDQGFDPSGVPVFEALKDDPEYQAVARNLRRDSSAVSHARFAFNIFERELFPEGFTHDGQQKVWYLGSLYRCKIVRATPGGEVNDFYFPAHEEMLPIRGMRVDPEDGALWAATGDDEGRAALVRFNASGQVTDRYAPMQAGSHQMGDLVLRGKNEILLTDRLANQVYRFDRQTKSFTTVAVHRPLFSPGGIALADDSRSLYVADALGVIFVDLRSGVSRDLALEKKSSLAGIHGLYWHGGSLVAIQNAIGAPRILRLAVSPDGTRIVRTTVLESHTEFTVEPTTGTFDGDEFYFLTNVPVHRLENNRITGKERMRDIEVARVMITDEK